MARRSAVTPKGDGASTPPEVTPGGSRRRPGGKGWSGPSGAPPTTEELKASGRDKRLLYFTAAREATYRQACEVLGLDPEASGVLPQVWDLAIDALLEKKAAKKG
jgi:hypothetical protein